VPQALKPYQWHGVGLSPVAGSTQYLGECPFCDKPKFYAESETGLWDCKVCAVAGNVYDFLRRLHSLSRENTPPQALEPLAGERGIPVETLVEWGVCKSLTTGEWLVPGYSPTGGLTQLYRYVRDHTGKQILLCTAGVQHGVHGMNLLREKGRVYVCEGPWDAMALWTLLKTTKVEDDGSYAPTGNEEVSLLSKADVIAAPGAGVWGESWCKAVSDKDVVLCYDNDKAGLEGMKHACQVLSQDAEYLPKSTAYLNWAKSRVSLPVGYDVRDHAAARDHDALADLTAWTDPTPEGWVAGGGKKGSVEVATVKCESWKELRNQWVKSMRWTPGLEGGLACMLASITSVKSGMDQCWLKIISPPSGGKTQLCEALSVASRYVYARSDMNSFYSGYKEDKEAKQDFSLAYKLFDKTLLTKDADLLLQSPYKTILLSQARDLYDSYGGKDYGHGVHRKYEGLRMTWILCGTPALREIDRSELGQRFLDWVLVEAMDEEMERDITLRAILTQKRQSRMETGKKAESLHSPEYLKVMQMTGGYVEYLRRNWVSLIEALDEPDEAAEQCLELATMVSYLRARPNDEKKSEDAVREIPPRLGKQLYKMAQFVAVVTQRKGIDRYVMSIIKKIAVDTGRGRTAETVKAIDRCGPLATASVAAVTRQKPAEEEEYLTFLRVIGVVDFVPWDEGSGRTKYRWTLTDRFARVWAAVQGMPNYQT